MFSRVLVANRGEVAVRVIRAVHELGMEAVAVYSTVDSGALHVRLADRAVCVGPPSAAESYLNVPSIIAAGETTGCEAVHPGWGFLAENPEFVRACEDNDLVFVGPDEARSAAAELGYPVLLKPSAGGGGKGMRLVEGEGELDDAFDRASAEAFAAFGDGRLYVEKLITPARHVEVQVLCDADGGVLTLGERECSIQRRHQKLIEESPSAALDEETRAALETDVARACRAIGYLNAGTFEFLLAPDGSYHFIELNARLQVEHPVSEVVTGIDIVREQLRIAAGEQLHTTGRAERRGHSIEVRLNAEDPSRGFAPSPGVIERFRALLGPGIRVDTHVEEGAVISPYYDSLIGKVIVWDEDRPAAIGRCLRALGEVELRGVQTTREVAIEILQSDEFRSGSYSTSFLEKRPLSAVGAV